MKTLCLIPARGGSKRLPRKNIRSFLGKPIIAYAIRAALDSGLFDEVMVSTDDEEIAAKAKEYGARVPFYRSPENADDHATTLDVVREVLGRYPTDFDRVCCLYATAPFIQPSHLRAAAQLLDESGADCVFPVLRYGFPVQRSVVLDAAGRVRMRQPEYQTARSQDLEPVFHDAGQFYFFRPAPVLAAGRLWTDDTRALELPETEAHDIDTETDWQLAEMKYRLLHDA